MADNIMGGYEASDITANIEVNLNNIDRSTQDAATLASQLKDWGTSIEAANKQLQDYNTSQEDLLETASQLADTNERIVQAARELKEISAQSNVNFRDLAQNAREIQNALSGLSGAGAAPYVPGVASAAPASVVDPGGAALGYGLPGASSPEDYGLGGGGSMIPDLLAASAAGGGGAGGGGRGKGAAKNGKYRVEGEGTYGQTMANKLLGINYWMPGGKAAALGRYVDKLSNGGVSRYLGKVVNNNPWFFGTPTQDLNAAGEEAFRSHMAEQGFLNAAGEGISAEEANALLGDASSGMTVETIQGGAVAAAEAGGLGVAAQGGVLGALGGAMEVAAPIAAAGYLGYKAYQAYAGYQQQGQVLASLTGQTGDPGRMVGYEASDFVNTLFNPLMGYGAAKEIQMTGLAAGFQGQDGTFGGGSGLFGAYTNFASGAYQNYGISAQDSMTMFQAGVIQAGASAQQLTGALASLANVSATTNTSFSLLKENFTSFLGTIAGLGATGAGAVALAQANSTVFANNELLGGASSTAGIIQSQAGEALVAQQMGISYSQFYNRFNGPGGATAVASASNKVLLGILANMGLTPGMPGLKQAVGNLAYALPTILTQLGLTPPNNATSWTQETAVNYVIAALSNGGTGASAGTGTVNSVAALISKITGGKTGEAGITNAFNYLNNVNSLSSDQANYIDYNGKQIDMNTLTNQSQQYQQTIYQALLQGKATMDVGTTYGIGGTVYYGAGKTLAQYMGNQGLEGINNGTITQIELGPKAAALFQLINNPQTLTNQQLKYLASLGIGSNTGQTTGWSS